MQFGAATPCLAGFQASNTVLPRGGSLGMFKYCCFIWVQIAVCSSTPVACNLVGIRRFVTDSFAEMKTDDSRAWQCGGAVAGHPVVACMRCTPNPGVNLLLGLPHSDGMCEGVKKRSGGAASKGNTALGKDVACCKELFCSDKFAMCGVNCSHGSLTHAQEDQGDLTTENRSPCYARLEKNILAQSGERCPFCKTWKDSKRKNNNRRNRNKKHALIAKPTPSMRFQLLCCLSVPCQ